MHKFLKFIFWNKTLHVSDSSSAHQLAAESCQYNLYDIHHCCVYSVKLPMMDRGTIRNK